MDCPLISVTAATDGMVDDAMAMIVERNLVHAGRLAGMAIRFWNC
jgi:hypothetical protein